MHTLTNKTKNIIHINFTFQTTHKTKTKTKQNKTKQNNKSDNTKSYGVPSGKGLIS